MAQIDFPSTPSDQQVYTINGKTWKWDAASDTWLSSSTDLGVIINPQTGTTYTVAATDNRNIITLDNTAAITLTVPSGLGLGFVTEIIQIGTGQVTVVGDDITLNSYSGLTALSGQHAAAILFAYISDVFNLSGNLA